MLACSIKTVLCDLVNSVHHVLKSVIGNANIIKSVASSVAHHAADCHATSVAHEFLAVDIGVPRCVVNLALQRIIASSAEMRIYYRQSWT